MASNTSGIPLSKISPRYLHSNSTSHTWVFSAFAELIDNAYDPDVKASDLLIDKVEIRGETCLIFLDNGAGMDREQLHKMLSFGFCEKEVYENTGEYLPIGHYGNGFKSGSMRIGKDALVFTRSTQSASIGFLSQSYLHGIDAESVVIPILDYRLPHLERIESKKSRNNLNAILSYSVFKHENELKEELKALEGRTKGWRTGTKIIISTLSRLKDGNLELDFLSDPTDIRCPEPFEVDFDSVYNRPIQQSTSDYKLSLKAYCSILYLKPRMRITIRDNRVKSRLISRSLAKSEKDSYKPSWLKNPIRIIFGFTCERERSEDYGMMLYHRNRLIKAYERVGCQTKANEQGVGVVGVAEVNCLKPSQNKQNFDSDGKYNSVLKAFATKLNEYWGEKMGHNPTQPPPRDSLPDWTWAQCESCLQWRRMPDSVNADTLPDKWYCYLNSDGNYNRCDIPEEPEDEDLAAMPKFEKTVKKRREKERRQRRLQQAEEEKQKETRATSSRQPESPTKRRGAVVESLQSNASKKRSMETETGEVVTVTRNCADDKYQNTKNSTSRTSRASAAAKTGAKSSGKLKVSLPSRSAQQRHSSPPVVDVDEENSNSPPESPPMMDVNSDPDAEDTIADVEALKQTSEKKNQEKACEKQKSPAAPALSEASDKSPGVEGVMADNATTDCSGESMEVESSAENAPEGETSNRLDTLLVSAMAAFRQMIDKEKQVTSDGTDGSNAVDVSTGASVPVSVPEPARAVSAVTTTAASTSSFNTTTSASSSPVPVTSLSKQKVSESLHVNGSIDHGISENNDVNMDSDTDRSNKVTDNGAGSCISEITVTNVGVTNNAQIDKNANDKTIISQRQAPNDPVGEAENVNETNVALHGETGTSPDSSKPAEHCSSNCQSSTSCISHPESNSEDSLPTPSQDLDSAASHPEPARASKNGLISHECSNETQSQMQEELISLRKEVTFLRSEAAKTQALLREKDVCLKTSRRNVTLLQSEAAKTQALLEEKDVCLKTLRRYVYRYLQLQVPDMDLGDEQLIDQLLQTMVDDN